MTNQSSSQPTIGNLTLLELKQLIENIAKETVKKEILITKKKDAQLFVDTFGAWEDDRTEPEIIEEIYESRIHSFS
jgi:hypothetical protein